MYKLKQTEPPFEIVDGPFAGRKYDRKGTYAEIPPGYESRFESLTDEGRGTTDAEDTIVQAKRSSKRSDHPSSIGEPLEVTHE